MITRNLTEQKQICCRTSKVKTCVVVLFTFKFGLVLSTLSTSKPESNAKIFNLALGKVSFFIPALFSAES